MDMNVNKYIRRIDYNGSIKPTLSVLEKLQKQHLLNVPFENLDIHYGSKIILSVDNLFEKIIEKQRGGFCYELNGLFHALLSNFGFKVKMVSAQVVKETGEIGAEFDHMALLVQLEANVWLTDVGFGDFTVGPLKLIENVKQNDDNGIFSISTYDSSHFKVSKFDSDQNEYKPIYIFSTRERTLSDFEDMCEFHQTSPKSHFTHNRICSILTHDGRMTLTDTEMIIKASGHTKTFLISGQEAFWRELKIKFGISFDTSH
jgi:N-hydroxyarylamine O-acetyltransferase